MFQKRNLNPEELEFVTKQIRRTKKLLMWLLIALAIVVAFLAFAVYSSLDGYNILINICFGILILCIYGIYWFYKGFQKHKVNPEVHKSSGFYERVVIYHGKTTSRFDSINGTSVKIPWHWRNYLKSQKERINYEYILRDGAVAANDNASQYVVSLNNTLSLDYELKNGLHKAKPLNFFSFLALFLMPFIVLFASMDNDLDKGLHVSKLFQNESDAITLQSAEELNSISQPSYITIEKAWVHRFKTMSDYRGKNVLISKAERDRIYNDPASSFNHLYHLPARAITKPDKETFINNMKSNSLYKKLYPKNVPDSIWNKTIENEYSRRIDEYNKQVRRAKSAEKLVETIQPKTSILELKSDAFHSTNTSFNSVKESLENSISLFGYYHPEKNTLISIEEHKTQKKRIQNAFISLCILFLSGIYTVYYIGKVIYNSRLKKQLVEDQIELDLGSNRVTE
ncbi:hypothetical protein [Winogradskyella sp. SM1960]|uniref:hypothetical protein n=1 Tax=Winogradskyella sp. SM1960 TaxID=2865955 RepID=UPI001CD41D9F|nr:hypothetical protein [Winogradskyella sp. SM1960]